MDNLCGKKFFKIYEFEIKKYFWTKYQHIYTIMSQALTLFFCYWVLTFIVPSIFKMNGAHLVRKKIRTKPLVHNNILVVLNMWKEFERSLLNVKFWNWNFASNGARPPKKFNNLNYCDLVVIFQRYRGGCFHSNMNHTHPLRWLIILKYFQNILGIFCLKVEKHQIWFNKMWWYIIM